MGIAKALALKIPSVKQIEDDRQAAENMRQEAVRRAEEAERQLREIKANSPQTAYKFLPGTEYSAYAVPIEYPPSRDYRPRWGNSRPCEPILDAWFRNHVPAYLAFLDDMRRLAGNLADIPVQFDESQLPCPAWAGVPYCPFDAVALYTMVHKYRPKIYLEIGSGVSTCFAYRAVRDAGLATQIVSIDPEPRAKIDELCDRIERVGLETCDLSLFDTLEAGDILFFDGSHRSFMNSDVTVFMIDVLPHLKRGVVVHVHDITLPYDYPAMFQNWYWNEQYLLAVYLMGNKDRIDPLLPTAFVCRDAFASEDLTMVDLGEHNARWRGGGAMWFTHTR